MNVSYTVDRAVRQAVLQCHSCGESGAVVQPEDGPTVLVALMATFCEAHAGCQDAAVTVRAQSGVQPDGSTRTSAGARSPV